MTVKLVFLSGKVLLKIENIKLETILSSYTPPGPNLRGRRNPTSTPQVRGSPSDGELSPTVGPPANNESSFF
jgi:hypothetical protein